ncbi:glycerol-3-phosphate acyltransferase PlsY [Tistlia consotensis]|uniref:Glycerol-3-phosphate acyltransferase n=1 Tax=Tistlia consotensis USBA 355 TaxID=560819 RepID=A0A1Y6BPI2_9PROT|nr:glycerol-3-phosphate 1-O-acyltransferase PlsY [Tistlia consotensis]SMF20702.1 glycerol-3-phosphate acyltransferase PlsY [Tistlia consotensis USBA 355]SNR47644.1 glycerol-3-phosphate acyltransferase PlsY [Tistlia consotensis]
MPDPISWEFAWPYLLAALAAGYLLGSIPFGLVLTRLAGLGDIRKIGSGNIGMTNVLRTGRKDLAAATLVLDSGKGAAAALLAYWWGGPDPMIVAGFGAVVGHLFPVWLGFRGGKGVATTLGTLLAVSWPVGLAACATWALVAALFRYSSLAALVSLAASPIFAWFLRGNLQLVQFAAILAILVWSRHLQNIGRLLRGQESRLGQKAAPKADAPDRKP